MIIRALFIAIFFGCFLSAQIPVYTLDSIIVPDKASLSKSKTQSKISIDKEIINQYTSDLTSLLKFQSPIYFKENGNGMVSSPSFRGTTAQQTAVVWNGININSKLLGQTDFNAVSTDAYDEIIVAPGGGSVIYGNGAIGGSVHLNNKIQFNKKFTSSLQAKVGSYNFYALNANLGYSNHELAIKLGFGQNQSDNDYELSSIDYKNINGDYKRSSFYLNSAYIFNDNNRISLFSEFYKDDRGFSLVESTGNKTAYKNNNRRVLLQWENNFNAIEQKVSVAHLKEEYNYFEVRGEDALSNGNVVTNLFKYNGKYKFNKEHEVQVLSQISKSNAEGEGSGITEEERVDYNISGLYNYTWKNFYAETGLRWETSDQYKSPLLYSLGLNYKLNKANTIKLNLSKNFRSPTFNDLFWEPGGNPDLKAEKSRQIEIGSATTYKGIEFSITGFYNKISDMIRWLPTNNNYWEPQNTDKVITKGLEVHSSFIKKYRDFDLGISANYSFIKAKNSVTDIPLAYVPEHIFNTSIRTKYKGFSFIIESIINGKVSTKESVESPVYLEAWGVANAGIYYELKKLDLNFGIKLNNLTDEVYATVPYRPMPPRNWMVQINYSL